MKPLFIIVFLASSHCFGQQNNIDTNYRSEYIKMQQALTKYQEKIEGEINQVSIDLSKQSQKLNKNNDFIRAKVTSIYDSLARNTKLVNDNNSKIISQQSESEKNFLYSVIGILCLSLLIGGIYIHMQRRARSNEQKTLELIDQLSTMSTTSSEDIASALEKFASIVLTQPKTDSVPDHSMVFEFAKQIVSMENNLSRMDPEVRGLNRITRAIENMHNTLKTMNYEIVPLLGSNLIEGQIIEIGLSEPDVSIEAGKKIIYNVVKAEILFNGKQIQRAKVDIKYNPND